MNIYIIILQQNFFVSNYNNPKIKTHFLCFRLLFQYLQSKKRKKEEEKDEKEGEEEKYTQQKKGADDAV